MTMAHKFSISDVEKYAASLGIKFDKFTPETLQMGMDVEMEHGQPGPLNVTNGDGLQTAKIALAHLAERPDYYELLKKVESEDGIAPVSRQQVERCIGISCDQIIEYIAIPRAILIRFVIIAFILIIVILIMHFNTKESIKQMA